MVEGGGWRVVGGGWWVEGGGWRVVGGAVARAVECGNSVRCGGVLHGMLLSPGY